MGPAFLSPAPSHLKGKEEMMDVKEYCSTMRSEVTGWKARVYDVLRRIDEMPSSDKAKVDPLLNDLHTAIDELTARIEKLSDECPSDWGVDKAEIDGKFSQLKKVWEEIGKAHRFHPHL
jgi:hypothetical protein